MKDWIYGLIGSIIIAIIICVPLFTLEFEKSASRDYTTKHCHLIETAPKNCYIDKDCFYNICDTGKEVCSWAGKVVCD